MIPAQSVILIALESILESFLRRKVRNFFGSMQIFVLWRYFVVRYCEVLLRRSFARQPRLIRRSLCSVEPRALDELSGRGLCFFFEDMLYSTMSLWRYYMSLMALTGGSALASGQTQAPAEVLVSGQTACDDCLPRVAVTTNLLHDAALTPDLGLEVSIARRWSVAAEGVWAWWSNARRHRYWRIAGGRLEFRWHPGDAPMKRALTGHHIGIYGSAHTFDFEFGGQGWQSPRA